MTTDRENTVDDTNGTRPRLLIADDDQVVSATLSAQLRREFDVVATAEDGTAAITLARSLQPDVALVDVQMPGGGGLHTTRGIVEVSPRTAIVILSVDESDQSVVEFINAGAMTYLRKGLPAPEIASRLHQSIAAHERFDR
jgi:DNA-binding NarL/FixJ family response regulator